MVEVLLCAFCNLSGMKVTFIVISTTFRTEEKACLIG